MVGNSKRMVNSMKSMDRMGVYLLMSHLIITLVILAIYGYTLHTGQGDETLKTILTVIIGYWFGSMGAQAIRKPDSSKNREDEK
jgi:heme O synthase-like polyprenyltransferase